MSVVEFPHIIERGCGLDVHKDTAVASIKGRNITERTETFLTFTEDLERLVCFLQNEGVTHIAMESTGVYWPYIIFWKSILPFYRLMRGI